MATPLDDLTTLATADRLLRDSRATGAGVRVAVIDSGVERAVLAERHPTMRPIQGGLFRASYSDPLPYEGHQSAPHGTTVADVILTVAPECELYSADVFGPAGSCEVETVVRALQYVVDHWNCKVINLSLGVPESRLQPVQRRNALLRAIEEAYYRDVLVVAAAHNDHPLTRSYPAAFAPPLVSVDKGLFTDPFSFAYKLRDQVEFQAHARGYLGPFAAEPATSWAAPHVAGIAARLASLKPDIKPFEFKTLLYWMSQRGTGGRES
ncbi:MAG: S8 family serine peptidase [Gemmataceae bacterium]